MSEDDLPYGERCKTYTGMPVPGTQRRRTMLDSATLRHQANDNLMLLPTILRRERNAREERLEAERIQKLADRLYRAALREDIRWAKAEVRRVRCGCKDCRRYSKVVNTWLADMRATLKEKPNA